MTIVPASRLSPSDLALLGNNVVAAAVADADRRRPARCHDDLAAVNRSLASVGERVGRLHPRRRRPARP